MGAVSRRLNDQLPATERTQGISVVPLSLDVVGPQSRLALWMLGGAVFCVFLIGEAINRRVGGLLVDTRSRQRVGAPPVLLHPVHHFLNHLVARDPV